MTKKEKDQRYAFNAGLGKAINILEVLRQEYGEDSLRVNNILKFAAEQIAAAAVTV